jgi:5'-3' exonuclease
MVEWEADDALGTAAVRWSDDPAVEKVVVLTPDKDMAQLVREDGRVVQYDRRKREFMDADGVRAKFGVSPESIPDFLALVGDAADGYPGVPGWGKLSAGAVLKRYGHLEDIPDSVGRWDLSVRSAPALAASLREHRDLAMLFRELATLVTDVPIRESLEDLRWRGAPRREFTAMAERLAQPQLMQRVHRWAD